MLDGDDPAPPPKIGAQPSIFGPCLLWPNGWIDQDAYGTGVGLGSGDIVLDGVPPKNGHSPQFSARVYCGKTVVHLSIC